MTINYKHIKQLVNNQSKNRGKIFSCFYFVNSFIVACLFLVSCAEKLPDNDVQSLMLHGDVAVIEEDFYYGSYLFDKIVLNEKLYNRYYSFDINGRFTEFTHVNEFFRKNNSNKLVDIVPDSLPLSLIDSIKVQKDTILISDSVKWAKLSKWEEEKNNLIEPDYIRKEYRNFNDSVYLVSNFDENAYLLSYEDCRMSKGKISTIRSYTNNDQLLSKTEYSYDCKNRLINKVKYYEKISYQTKFTYKWGQKYESYSYTSKHAVYSFNKSGLIKKQKNYIGKFHVSTFVYKYNKMNNLINLQGKDKISGEIKESIFSYKYDNHHNWTERVEKRYDGNIFVTHRRINYY